SPCFAFKKVLINWPGLVARGDSFYNESYGPLLKNGASSIMASIMDENNGWEQ
ncbi:hypothetical protein HMPREF0494_2213, partial [Limosilactobacillus antri DSM 16041]